MRAPEVAILGGCLSETDILRGKGCLLSSACGSRLDVIHRETQLIPSWPVSYLQSVLSIWRAGLLFLHCVSGEKWALHNCSLRLFSLLGDLQHLPFLSLISLLFLGLPCCWIMNLKSLRAEKQLDICPFWSLSCWQWLFIFFCFPSLDTVKKRTFGTWPFGTGETIIYGHMVRLSDGADRPAWVGKTSQGLSHLKSCRQMMATLGARTSSL